MHLLGRRGPAQAAFTAKELRELLGLPGVRVCIEKKAMELSEVEREELSGQRVRKRVYELLAKAAGEGGDVEGGDVEGESSSQGEGGGCWEIKKQKGRVVVGK